MQSGFFSKQVESAPESDLDVRLDSTALEQRLHAVAIAKLLRSGEGASRTVERPATDGYALPSLAKRQTDSLSKPYDAISPATSGESSPTHSFHTHIHSFLASGDEPQSSGPSSHSNQTDYSDAQSTLHTNSGKPGDGLGRGVQWRGGLDSTQVVMDGLPRLGKSGHWEREEDCDGRRCSDVLNLPEFLYSDDEDNAQIGSMHDSKLSGQDRCLPHGSSQRQGAPPEGSLFHSTDSTSASPQEPKHTDSTSRTKKDRFLLEPEKQKVEGLAREEAHVKPKLTKMECLALQHRKKGNKFYTEKDFPAALGSYMRANQQSPGDIFILTNLVAASVRLGNYTLAIKKAAKAVNLFEKEDLLSRGDMFKPCLLDLHWWNHLAHWCGGDREPALISLELVITLASQLRRHRRFAIAVKQHRELRLKMKAEKLPKSERCLQGWRILRRP